MNDSKRFGGTPRKIVLYYLILSGLWIYLSNAALHYSINDAEMHMRIATFKGWAFVCATAGLLYLLVKHYISMIREREQNCQTQADLGQQLERELTKNSECMAAQEEHIRQSQRLDSIGALAGGVAHDFNNILTIVIGASALLEQYAVDNPEQMALITQISSSAERAANLTRSLLAFSRRQSINKQPEDLGDIITIMKNFLDRIIGEDIMLTAYLPDEPFMVMIDRAQIEQVLMTLAANARDAMPCGGCLTFEVSLVEKDDPLLEQEGCSPGDYALITVSDTGEGIDKAVQQRIFEPFFTTKIMGNGAGLGLSMVYGIIRKHNGMIQVSSQPGGGTTFRMYLPLR